MATSDDDMEVMAGYESRKFDPKQLQKDLQINDADLDGCMTEQASLYATTHHSMHGRSTKLITPRFRLKLSTPRRTRRFAMRKPVAASNSLRHS